MSQHKTLYDMVREAVDTLSSDNLDIFLTYPKIIQWVVNKYDVQNKRSVRCHITELTVNAESRVHYGNKKPRVIEEASPKDFLFREGKRNDVKLWKYDPARHGKWEIREDLDSKKLKVQEFDHQKQEAMEYVSGKSSAVRKGLFPKPSPDQVDKYLAKWKGLENYTLQEASLHKLFREQYRFNTDIDDILAKVAILNDFYSTNIFATFKVARRIESLNIDERLETYDPTLVEEIAVVDMGGGVTKRFYSFATKYCSHHNPNDYPIYDSYVKKSLAYFRKDHGFEYETTDLTRYARFKEILLRFQRQFGLTQYSLKQIDQYLWLFGKENFPNSYQKRSKP